MRVAVVGAGALGVASAYHLAQAGHDVTVYDRGQIAGETTGYAAGILSLALLDTDDQALTRWTMDALDNLPPDPMAGADTGPMLHRPGSFLLAGPDTARLLPTIADGIRALDTPCTLVSPDEWAHEMDQRDLTPDTNGITQVLSSPYDAWALSTSTTERIWRHAKQHGATLAANHTISHLLHDNGHVTGLAFAGGTHHTFDTVVLAAGAWTRRLLDTIDLRLPTQAFRTHAAVLRTTHAAHAPILHDDAGGYYLRPESDQHLLVGNGTRTEPIDPDATDHEAEDSFRTDIAHKVPKRLPALADAGLQNAWRGVLTGVPDRRPLVGPHPDARGLHLCTGGNGYGFMRAMGLGACLAATIDGRGAPHGLPERVLERMDPARFWPDPPAAFAVREGFSLEGAVGQKRSHAPNL